MQPFLRMKFSPLRRKNSCARPNPLRFGAFASEIGCSCSEKEQEWGVFSKTHQGATYSQETGCTLFALLNSIRGQGATTPAAWFIGWRLSWGNVSHKCAACSYVHLLPAGGRLTDRRYIKTKPGRHSL
ncbi:hypothetical protein [Pseudomonas extremaustralis]|uniref:hypothetical protein n=1 Tax=Pseudomonas extremaustralis TaxID=359110 RepID=UPI002306EEAF|nr:hypothetical protein [Pseudomonas extremaustralis]MDB1108691.1 hypothetical protein [Pseudomonas extremaustralis]